MNDGCQPYMLDTNVFNDVLDGKISFASLVGRRLVVIRVQAAELRATRNTLRRKRLLAVFEVVNPSIQYASSFAWNIDGAGWNEACWNDGSGTFQRMLARLTELDAPSKNKDRGPRNKIRDILIAETAIKINAVLISGDANLRLVVSEFGGKAVDRFPV